MIYLQKFGLNFYKFAVESFSRLNQSKWIQGVNINSLFQKISRNYWGILMQNFKNYSLWQQIIPYYNKIIPY